MARAVRVPVPSEPEALRPGLRAGVAEAPGNAHELVAAALAGHLATWAAPHAEPAVLASVLEASRYETFLWVMGDRPWGQVGDHLAGRLARRAGL